jgi:outer membrane protein OmpA-like peptidoglycan-associated protein
MKTIRNLSGVAVATCALSLIACAASLPPPDLVNARTAYDRAASGPAKQLNPADVHVAKKQLAVAEAEFRNNGDTPAARDQAYLALRKAELAEVVARTRSSEMGADGVEASMHAEQGRAVARTAAELARTRNELATQGAEASATRESLEEERARREKAEADAAQARADLAKFASVKQEARGMVITLSGGVLFESGKSALLPSAQLKLNDVAKSLIQEDPDSKIVVEGHTDSQGAADFNQTLSQQRAQAVRDYLVSRGIASDRVTAQGFGFSRSVADNKSAEGRANNRRVEIVVQPASGQASR